MPGPPREVAFMVLAAFMGVALLVLLWAAWLAARSRRPSPRKPPRKTFEHGRRLARLRQVASVEAACEALQDAPVGELASARPTPASVEVVMFRKRNQPCPQALGYVTGLFESAWAHEVVVAHEACSGPGGGECRYHVQKIAIASALPREGARIPGSQDGRHRSPPARAGGG